MNADVKSAAEKHPNIKMIFKDAQNDTLKQRAHVEELVSAGVDLIIISPKEAQPLTETRGKSHGRRHSCDRPGSSHYWG